jgi:hypothetical protein
MPNRFRPVQLGSTLVSGRSLPMTILAIVLLATGAALIFWRLPTKQVDEDEDAAASAATAPATGSGGSNVDLPTAGGAMDMTSQPLTPSHPTEIAGLRMLSLRPNAVASFTRGTIAENEPFGSAVRFMTAPTGSVLIEIVAGRAPADFKVDAETMQRLATFNMAGSPFNIVTERLNTAEVTLASGQPAVAGFGTIPVGRASAQFQLRLFREGDIAWRVSAVGTPQGSSELEAVMETLAVVNPADYDKGPASSPAATRPTTRPR